MDKENKYTNYNREKFVDGKPIDVLSIGKVRFLTYDEYIDYLGDLSMMNMNVLHIYHQYYKMLDKKNEESMKALEEIKSESLVNIVRGQMSFVESYAKIFTLVLSDNSDKNLWDPDLVSEVISNIVTNYKRLYDEDLSTDQALELLTHDMLITRALEKIFTNEELFMEIRRLILDMQMLVEEVVYENPEVQKGIEISKQLKRDDPNNKDAPGTADIVTSIVIGSSYKFEEVFDLTVIQVQALFYRIGAFKNHDATTLFATVPSDKKITIEPWSKRIDLFKQEVHNISREKFDSTYGNLMK